MESEIATDKKNSRRTLTNLKNIQIMTWNDTYLRISWELTNVELLEKLNDI